jgi:hypothetical protein
VGSRTQEAATAAACCCSNTASMHMFVQCHVRGETLLALERLSGLADVLGSSHRAHAFAVLPAPAQHNPSGTCEHAAMPATPCPQTFQMHRSTARMPLTGWTSGILWALSSEAACCIGLQLHGHCMATSHELLLPYACTSTC